MSPYRLQQRRFPQAEYEYADSNRLLKSSDQRSVGPSAVFPSARLTSLEIAAADADLDLFELRLPHLQIMVLRMETITMPVFLSSSAP